MLRPYPKISIITPSYNQGQYIEETIQSVLSQQYPALEYIVIDGASTDQSVAVIKSYESQLTYWISEKDQGQTAAINKGLRRATGDIVTWINSDDVLMPDALNKVADVFEKNKDVALIHGQSFLFGNKIKEQVKAAPVDHLPARYLAYIPFPQPSSFFRLRVTEHIGLLDETLNFGMDYDLLVRIALQYPILSINELLSKYRIHGDSKTTQPLQFAKDWAKVYSKLLRSLPATEKYVKYLEQLGLYHEGKEVYTCVIPPSSTIIEQSFCYFLEIQIHYHYDSLELETTRKLLAFMRQYYPHFYQEKRMQYLSIKTNLGKQGISFLRQFTR